MIRTEVVDEIEKASIATRLPKALLRALQFRKITGTSYRDLLTEQNTRLIFGGEKVGCAVEPTEGVVMEQLRHDEMILPLASRSTPAQHGIIVKALETKVRHQRPTAHARARYRCFLPDLAGLAGMRRAGPMPDQFRF